MSDDAPTPPPPTRTRGRRITRALSRARTVQLRMLPPPPSLDQAEIDVFYEACEELGGDFYDFIQLGPGQLGIVLADVSGHGVDAALMMAAAKKTLQILARTVQAPAEVLKAACVELGAEIPTGSFITAWYGVLNLDSGELTFASAGHNPLILCRHGGKEAPEQIGAKGLVLGAAFVDKIQDALEEKTIQLHHGDMLLMYTDGASEAMGANDEEFGADRLVQAAAQGPQSGAAPLITHLRSRITEFCAGRALEDDITLLALRYTGGEAPGPAWRPRIDTNLLPRTDPFVGRQAEMAAMREGLSGDGRIVSVVGVAGLGKTRLALEAARAIGQDFAGGTWMVQLSACRSADDFYAAFAETLRLNASGKEPPEQLLGRMLGLRGPTLAVLDNAESVIETVREAVARWRVLAPDFHCIITSQIRPGVKGSHEITLRPLGVPPADAGIEEALQHAAVELFLNRAQRAQDEFELTDENVKDVVAICRELDGMPLAIELTASRMDVMTPGQALGQMQHPSSRIAMLRARTQGLSAQYTSLREALEWSFDQLSEFELATFTELCAFQGGFFLEAAEEVVDTPDGERLSGAVQGLLDKSFLWREGTPYGSRFNALGALRAFALHLAADGQMEEVERRHCAYYALYGADWKDRFNGADMYEATQRLVYERANIKQALETALRVRDAEAAVSLGDTLSSMATRSGGIAEAIAQLEPMVDLVKGDAKRDVWLQRRLGFLHQRLGNLAAAREHYGNAEKAAEKLPEGPERLSPTYDRALLDAALGMDADAARRVKEIVETFRELGDLEQAGRGHMALAAIYNGQKKISRALEQCDLAQEVYEKLNSPFKLAGVKAMRADALIAQGKLDAAWELLEELDAIQKRLNTPGIAVQISLQRAQVLEQWGRYDDALETLHAAMRAVRQSGAIRHASNVQTSLADVYLAVEDYESASEAAGAALDMALTYGLEPIILRAYMQVGEAELAMGDKEKAVEHLSKGVVRALGKEAWPAVLQGKALLSLAQLEVGKAQQADETARSGLQVAHDRVLEETDEGILLLAARARALLALKRDVDANRLASLARKRAKKAGHGKHSANRLIHKALTLIDVPAGKTTREVMKVQCAKCNQKYTGSPSRIRALKKCLNCGATPFVSKPG